MLKGRRKRLLPLLGASCPWPSFTAVYRQGRPEVNGQLLLWLCSEDYEHFFFFFEKGWCVFVPGVYNLILNIMFINLLNEWILDCCNTVSKTKCFLWTPLSSASNSILWDWRAMSPVTAVSVNTELFVCYKRSRRTVLWDRIVVPAGGTVALLLDGLHCVF